MAQVIEKIVRSKYPPRDTRVIWLDVTCNEFKVYTSVGWTSTIKPEQETLAKELEKLLIDSQGLENILAYGVEVDFSRGKSSPQCSRIGNALYHKTLPVQSEFRGCIVKDGKFQYWLDPVNWNLKEDGTPSKLDGTDGSIMGYVPKHYFKFEDLLKDEKGNVIKFRVWESTFKIDDNYVEVPAMYISSDRVTIDKSADKTVCVINTSTNYRGGGDRAAQDTYLGTDAYRSDLGKPRTAISRGSLRTKARKANEYLLNYEFYKFVFYWNFVVEYATLNSQLAYNEALTSDSYHQGGLGAGFTEMTNWDKYNGCYPCIPIGYTNEFGNFSGVKNITIPAFIGTDDNSYTEQTKSVCRYRCFNQPFGDIFTILDGCIGIGDGNNGQDVYTTKNPELHNDSSIEGYDYKGKQTAPNGYYKYTIVGKDGEMIPTESGGNSTTYFCDYNYIGTAKDTKYALLVGCNAGLGTDAGLGCFYSSSGVSSSDANAGFRTFCFAE